MKDQQDVTAPQMQRSLNDWFQEGLLSERTITADGLNYRSPRRMRVRVKFAHRGPLLEVEADTHGECEQQIWAMYDAWLAALKHEHLWGGVILPISSAVPLYIWSCQCGAVKVQTPGNESVLMP